MSFRDAFRRRTPGYAGGTLEDQLLRDALYSQEPQVLTPQNQQAITRPRRATPPPDVDIPPWRTGQQPAFKDLFRERPRMVAGHPLDAQPARPAGIPANAHFDDNEYGGEWIAPDDGAPMRQPSFKDRFARPQQEGFGSSGEPFGSARPRRTQPRDVISDDAQYLRDLQLQPRTKKDKALEVIDAISAGLGNKPRTTLSKRERQIAEAEGRLGTELSVGQKQAQIAASQTRPQIQQASLDEREVNNALSQYNRLEHYDPDDPADSAIRKYFESRGLALPKKDKYRRPIVTKTDDGRIIVTGAEGSDDMKIGGQVVTDTARQPTPTQIGGQTFSLPQKQAAQITAQTSTAAANREAADTRSRRAQEGQDRRLQRRLDAPAKTGTGGRGVGPDKTANRRAAVLVGQIERARSEMEAADQKGDKTARESARLIGEQAASELNALGAGYEAGRGEGGYPYYKKGAQQAPTQQAGGRTIDGAIQAFTKRIGRAPTADEIARMKAALGQ